MLSAMLHRKKLIQSILPQTRSIRPHMRSILGTHSAVQAIVKLSANEHGQGTTFPNFRGQTMYNLCSHSDFECV